MLDPKIQEELKQKLIEEKKRIEETLSPKLKRENRTRTANTKPLSRKLNGMRKKTPMRWKCMKAISPPTNQ